MRRNTLTLAAGCTLAVGLVAAGWGGDWSRDAPQPPPSVRIEAGVGGPLQELVCTPEGGDPADLTWRVDAVIVGSGPVLDTRELPAATEVVCEMALRGGEVVEVVTRLPGNVLVFLIDDVGIDKVGLYDAHPDTPHTPVLDKLASQGVLFERAYANPLCSPTRSTIQTGRYVFRNGIGKFLNWIGPVRLEYDEVVLPELLDDHTGSQYDHSYVGKWHLGNNDPDDWTVHPNEHGWNHYSGVLHGLGPENSEHAPQSYSSWEQTTDGVQEWRTDYLSTVISDDAIEAMQTMQEPWLLLVGLHAAHGPMHEPPAHLHSRFELGDSDFIVHYHWMIESADQEIGRVLASDPDLFTDTTVFVLSDNGTVRQAVMPPLTTGKWSVYEGGIHVPMIAAGRGVRGAGRRTDALVHTVDLFPTIAELAGIAVDEPGFPEIDGVSFANVLHYPQARGRRRSVYAEFFEPNGPGPYTEYQQAVVSNRYKLIRKLGEPDELYDLQGVVEEGEDLLDVDPVPAEVAAIRDRLLEELPVQPF